MMSGRKSKTMYDYFDKLYRGDRHSLVRYIGERIREERRTFIITANPETFMTADSDCAMRDAIMGSDLVIADGIGIAKAAERLGLSEVRKIAGIELAGDLLKEAGEDGLSVFLFGSHEDTVAALSRNLKDRYPRINICGYENGYVQDKDGVMKRISALSPDIVMVALGIPEQEILIADNIELFTKGILLGVGGSFDVLSGVKKRAPRFFTEHGLEWLYRIFKEPRRLGRFFRNNIRYLFKIRNMLKKIKRT